MSDVKEIIFMTGLSLTLFTLFRHPLVLVGVLTFQSMPTIYSVIHLSYNTWMGYLLFLIFLGGLLVIFVYLSALIPNEIFTPSSARSLISFTIFLSLMGMALSSNKMNSKMVPMKAVSEFSSLFYNNIFVFMLSYLFICLTVTTYITSKYKTPMKSFF